VNECIQKAIEAADLACACRDGAFCETISPGCIDCPCAAASGYDYAAPEQMPCAWPGHAAIRSLARVCVEEAANLVEHPHTSYRRIELADKIRALLPAEADKEEAK